MNKAIPAVLVLALLSACMSLPGSDAPTTDRYALLGPDEPCSRGGEPLVLSVPAVGAGLATSRIASLDARTGEISYLKGVRWAAETDVAVKQRLAGDLECHGFTVLSSHRHKLGQRQLVCEVRALNLVRSGTRDEAEVGLSCLYYAPGDAAGAPIVSTHRRPVNAWSAPAAVAAVSAAYRAVLAELLAAIR